MKDAAEAPGPSPFEARTARRDQSLLALHRILNLAYFGMVQSCSTAIGDMVQLFIKFKSRRSGSFGNSQIGRVIEWLTTTWLRFTCLIFSILIIAIAPLANLPPNDKLMMVIFAPIGAVMYWYVLLFLLLASEYLGTFGKVLSRVLVIYFYLFSRLVVQRPPLVSLPLTKR